MGMMMGRPLGPEKGVLWGSWFWRKGERCNQKLSEFWSAERLDEELDGEWAGGWGRWWDGE